MSEWMVRSSRAFLLGLVVACGIQVLLDWNATLSEINVLRNAVRQRGENYVTIIGKAADDELGARDRAGLDRLTHGIFDDEDAIYVRFTDATGAVVWDKVAPGFDDVFRERGNTTPFVETYAKIMDRDTQRALHDPAALKAHVANSRYKDFAQAWTDATAKIAAAFAKPAATAAPNRGVVVYEDRLHDDKRQKDDKISYAIGTVLGEDGKDIGTVIVAFDMKRTNEAVRFKYLKFTGLCSFFVALILVQNTVSRRTKLRLLDLKQKYAAAKAALHEAMPIKDVTCGPLVARGAVNQSSGSVDGMLWTAADESDSLLVLVIDSDGEGVDAAAVTLHVARSFEERRARKIRASLDEELGALGAAAAGIPLTRPVGALLLRVDARSGAYEALSGGMAQLRTAKAQAMEAPELRPLERDVPEGALGPLFSASGMLEPGCTLLGVCADWSRVDPRSFADGVAKYVVRTQEDPVPAHDAATWARGKASALAERDIAIVMVHRAV